VILVTELTRWGRSMLDLFHTLQDLQAWDVSLVAQTGLQFDLRSTRIDGTDFRGGLRGCKRSRITSSADGPAGRGSTSRCSLGAHRSAAAEITRPRAAFNDQRLRR
jgi:hypothetical protein